MLTGLTGVTNTLTGLNSTSTISVGVNNLNVVTTNLLGLYGGDAC